MSTQTPQTEELVPYTMMHDELGEEVTYHLPRNVYNWLVYCEAQEGLLSKREDQVKKLESDLSEVRRPLAQEMSRLNETLTAANRKLAFIEADRDRLKALCEELRGALERITDSHARLEQERGSVVGTLTANARAALKKAEEK